MTITTTVVDSSVVAFTHPLTSATDTSAPHVSNAPSFCRRPTTRIESGSSASHRCRRRSPNSWINPAEEVETIAQQHLRTGASSRLNIPSLVTWVPYSSSCRSHVCALRLRRRWKCIWGARFRIPCTFDAPVCRTSQLSARRQSYVLKGLPQFFAHEGYAVELLASFAPDSVPSPVLVRDGWWIGRAFRLPTT